MEAWKGSQKERLLVQTEAACFDNLAFSAEVTEALVVRQHEKVQFNPVAMNPEKGLTQSSATSEKGDNVQAGILMETRLTAQESRLAGKNKHFVFLPPFFFKLTTVFVNGCACL